MSRTKPPEVTGVSPKDGPPGTEVKIRGDNFGTSANDLLCLTICGCDCTLSAEWKSSKLIIARSGPGKGLGDVIITTRSGGTGISLVKFRGYYETIGPTKESAVWVETPFHALSWARRSLSPASFHQEDPLGLSVESQDKTIPEDDLNELFPGCCGDLGSNLFSAGWFLLEYHQSTSFEDLKAGLSFLRRKVENQKEGELSFLKANVDSVIDQLDTLNKLADKFKFDSKSGEFTPLLEKKIEGTKQEAHKLFEDVLSRREEADAKRSALSVLQRFKFLFCLPSSIEKNMQTGDYDLIINEYARVKHLFGNSDVAIFRKFLTEIEERIGRARDTLLLRLKDPPLSMDDYIKVIKNLIYLEAAGDIPWMAIECFANNLNQGMHDLKDKFIVSESSESMKKGKTGFKPLEGRPHRICFVEDLVDLMEIRLPELWKLGQAYFSGEFNQNINTDNQTKFKTIMLNSIQTCCSLLRAAILPHSLNRNSQSRHTFGIWSNAGFEAVVPWLPHCLRYFRICYSCFIRIDLPSDALDMFSKLIFDLRLYIVLSLFHQASEDVLLLSRKEMWVIEMNEKYGGITEIPQAFDDIVRGVLQNAHEKVLIGEAREVQLLDNSVARKDILAATQNLITSFAGVLETLAFVTEEDPGERSSVISLLVGTSDVSKPLMSGITWEQRLLAISCNCDYLVGTIIPGLFVMLKSLGYPTNNELLTAAKNAFLSLHQRINDQYHEQKCDPLVGTIEPSMYQPKFDWDTVVRPTDVRPYAQEIIMNLIGVRSELHRVPQALVRRIMCRIIETVAEELARLMTCVKVFSIAGSIQATADILAVKDATKAYATEKSLKFFNEALESIPRLNEKGEGILAEIMESFKTRMALQLLCLND